MWGVTAIGYFLTPVGWPGRIIAFAAASLLVLEYPWTDPAGFLACGAFLAYQVWKARERKAGTAARPAR
jgi:hypothetical protein